MIRKQNEEILLKLAYPYEIKAAKHWKATMDCAPV